MSSLFAAFGAATPLDPTISLLFKEHKVLKGGSLLYSGHCSCFHGINDVHAVQLFRLSDDNLVPFLPKHLKYFLDGVLCECHVF